MDNKAHMPNEARQPIDVAPATGTLTPEAMAPNIFMDTEYSEEGEEAQPEQQPVPEVEQSPELGTAPGTEAPEVSEQGVPATTDEESAAAVEDTVSNEAEDLNVEEAAVS